MHKIGAGHAIKISIISTLLSLILPGCTTDNTEGADMSLTDTYTFPSNVTSVNVSGDTLLLGTAGSRIIEYAPSSASSTSRPLPRSVENTRTYFVYPLGTDRYLVSKRDHGVIYADYTGTAPKYSFLNLDSTSSPAKGTNYSAYHVESHGPDTLLISTTNGLAYTLRSTLGADSTCRFVEALRHKRQGRTEFIVNATRSRYPDGIDVFTPSMKYTIQGTVMDSSRTVPQTTVGDSITLADNGTIRIGAGKPIGIGLDSSPGSHAVTLDGILYFVSAGGGLQSADIRALQINRSTGYYRFGFAANGDGKMYFSNSGGLYSMTAETGPSFIGKPTAGVNSTAATVCGNRIFQITDNSLWIINPESDKSPEKAPGFKTMDGDRPTCMAYAEPTLYVGSREGMYAYDTKRKTTTSLPVETDDCTNPYFTDISYPFAGTLNQGIYQIDNGRARKAAAVNDVRQLAYEPSNRILVCRTNEKAIVFSVGDTGLKHVAEITAPTEILNVAAVGDTVYTMSRGRMMMHAVKGDSLTAISEKGIPMFYSGFALLGNRPVPYSDYSIVDNTALRPIFTDWKKITLVSWAGTFGALAAALLIIIFLGKKIKERRQELKNIQENITYYAHKAHVKKIFSSVRFDDFHAAKEPEGRAGALRRKLKEMLSEVGNYADNPKELPTQLAALQAECEHIAANAASLAAAIVKQSATFRGNKVLEWCNHEQKDKARVFLSRLAEIASENRTEAETMEEEAMVYGTCFERMCQYISETFEKEGLEEKFEDALRFRAENSKKILSDNRDAINILDKCLGQLRAYFGAMSPQIKKQTVLFSDKSESAYLYNWDALILLTILGEDRKKDIRQYVKWRYTVAEAGTDREIKKIENAQASFFNRDDGPGAIFIRESISQDCISDSIPCTLLDLAYMATWRYIIK